MVYIKIIGSEYYFDPCWGRGYVRTNKQCEVIALMSEQSSEYIKLGEPYQLNGKLALVNGEFSIGCAYLFADTISTCSEEEIEKLDREIDKHNMCIGTIKHKRYAPIKGEFWECEYDDILWKDKDLFPINLNGKLITYKELREMRSQDDYIVLQGDNGYSHCWSESVEFNKVFDVIERIFQEEFTNDEIIKGKNDSFSYKRVSYGERCGWRFGTHGELIIKSYSGEKRKSISIVSNS